MNIGDMLCDMYDSFTVGDCIENVIEQLEQRYNVIWEIE